MNMYVFSLQNITGGTTNRQTVFQNVFATSNPLDTELMSEVYVDPELDGLSVHLQHIPFAQVFQGYGNIVVIMEFDIGFHLELDMFDGNEKLQREPCQQIHTTGYHEDGCIGARHVKNKTDERRGKSSTNGTSYTGNTSH